MRIIIQNGLNQPIYDQIRGQIKSLILKGELSEGEQLPSIRNLAKELQISVITTKRAYEELEREGFIETVAGKGSYVAAQDKELLREKKLQIIEERLQGAVIEGRQLGLTIDELYEILKILYGEVE
ncbi:MAG: GntR family transcriptional regulator [Alkaliphilus sp.]|nr:GntR family transcriptional regulator [Alkaliphilus sp.]